MRDTIYLVDGRIPASTPEAQGISSRCILNFLDACEEMKIELHSLQIVRNGHSIVNCAAKPFTLDKQHRVLSAAKGVLSTAILFLVQDGKLDLEEKLVDIFPEAVPEGMDPNMRKVTVYHLLHMAVGHDHNIFYEMRCTDDWIKGFFSVPLAYEPGLVHIYNNGAPHVVAQIVKRRSGEDVPEYLKPRLFDKIGMDVRCDYQWLGQLEPTTLTMTSESLLRLAIFYEQEGAWEGEQLLRTDLARMVGKRHVPTVDFIKPKQIIPERDDTKRAGFGFYGTQDGMGSISFSGGMTNRASFSRDYNMAWAVMCNDRRTTEVLDAFRYKIFFHTYERPLPEDPEGFAALQERISHFSLGPKGAAFSGKAAGITGKEYVFDENERGLKSLAFDFTDGVKVTWTTDLGVFTTECGLGDEWKDNGAWFIAEPDDSANPKIKGYFPNQIWMYDGHKTKTNAAWTDEDTLTIHEHSDGMMSTNKFSCHFRGDDLIIGQHTFHLPVAPPPEKNPELMKVRGPLTGHLKR